MKRSGTKLIDFPQTRTSWSDILQTVTNLRNEINHFASTSRPAIKDELFKIRLALGEEATDKYLAHRTILVQLKRFSLIRALDSSLAGLDKSFAELEDLMQQREPETADEVHLLAA